MGDIVLAGATSGTTTLTPTAVSGTTTLTLPATTGTLVLAAAPTFTGQATIPTINLTGGQIAFPATAVPSANANTLDDYEEGTWTPTIAFNTTNGNLAYSVQDGAYTKIGNLVWVGGNITFSQTTGSSYFWINNLPFTAKNVSANFVTATGISVNGMTSIVGGVSAAVYPNTVTAYPYTGQTGSVGVILSAYCNGGTATLYFGFTYITS